MKFNQIKDILNNEPAYRQKQAKQAVFLDLAENWEQVKTFPKDLREKLNKDCPLGIKALANVSKDEKTLKALVEFSDGLKVETVLMRHGDGLPAQAGRNTVCVSSQVGCPLGCLFCATGKMGFKRNLTADEIIEQVLFFARYLKTKNEKITNIVFMGMGEPFLNYDNVLAAIRILNDSEGFNLGARHFSISTAGIPDAIKKLSEERLQVNMAISLHAPEDNLRSRLMPLNKQYNIGKVLAAVDDYIKATNRRVMFEYIMIDGINDSDEHAKKLAKLLKKPLYFVNLISYNPTGIFKPSPAARVKKFKEILEKHGIDVTQRHRFGADVKAACGQLAGQQKK
jgi:23S rRNA (adenine2503-C2)-methyltransferase